MSQKEERFSFQVERYFSERGTFPVVLSRKTPLEPEELEDFRETVFASFNRLTGVDVIDTQILDGEYWVGVLIELTGDSYIKMKNDQPCGEGSCISIGKSLQRDFAQKRHEEVIGFVCGSSAYSQAVLESLGREYFTNVSV